MDGVSAAASIVGIATTGIQLSIKLITLAGQISTAADRISAISDDVSLTSAILHQLGDLMSQKTSPPTTNTNTDIPIFNAAGLETTNRSAQICEKIFQEVERETAKASVAIRGRKLPIGQKVKLTRLEKVKWPFLQPGIEVLRTDLREAKGTLMLMLQLANLALSRRVADITSSGPSALMKQRDIIRSVLVLKRQQEEGVNLKSDNTELFENDEKQRHATTAQEGVEDGSTQRPSSANPVKAFRPIATIAEPQFAKNALVENEKDDSPELSKAPTAKKENEAQKDNSTIPVNDAPRPTFSSTSTPSGTESNDPATRKSSPQTLHSDDGQRQETAPAPKGENQDKVKDKAKAVKLRLFTLDPVISFKYALVKIQWNEADSRIPEFEIRELISQDDNDEPKSSKPSVFKTLLTLSRFERIWINNFIHSLGSRVTLIYLTRTEQDIQDHGMTFKNVPTFHLVTEAPAYTDDDDDVIVENRVKDLARPTWIKVHVTHVCPETLEEYALPWEWDERDPNYIIIKRWIPDSDQLILFEHTRALRERKEFRDHSYRQNDNLMLVQKKTKNKGKKSKAKSSSTGKTADLPDLLDLRRDGDDDDDDNIDEEEGKEGEPSWRWGGRKLSDNNSNTNLRRSSDTETESVGTATAEEKEKEEEKEENSKQASDPDNDKKKFYISGPAMRLSASVEEEDGDEEADYDQEELLALMDDDEMSVGEEEDEEEEEKEKAAVDELLKRYTT